jgi:ATP-binding cassette subfamily B protein/subfamily B ATP-binding cassette protein MsbA
VLAAGKNERRTLHHTTHRLAGSTLTAIWKKTGDRTQSSFDISVSAFIQSRRSMNKLLRPLAYFRPDWPRISVVALLMIASVALNLLKPWPVALLVDSVLGAKPMPPRVSQFFSDSSKWHLIVMLSLVLLAIHIGQGVLSALQNFTAIQVGLRGLTRVRNEVFAHLQRLSMRFHQSASTGDLIYRASWDTYSFQTLFQQGIVTFASAALSLALMVVVMWRVNTRLTLVALVTVPALLLVIKVLGKSMRERGTAAQQADSRVTALVQQAIAAMPLIQSFTREAPEAERFGEQTKIAETTRLAQHGWELVYWLAITTVFALGTTAIVWLGAKQVLAGALSVGELLVFLAYLAQLYEPLNQLSHVGATLASATAATHRVAELLDTPVDVKDSPTALRVVSEEERQVGQRVLVAHGAIEFRDVNFSYRADSPVLRDVNFALKPGESCAIIGPSGAGKSTLISLVPRFFDPDSGAVWLDGTGIQQLRVRDLRKHVAMVLQEPIILAATVAENIACGKEGASRKEIEAAARAANAHEFITRLPHQYDTMLGEGGARLSVGERQRINIARAFLKNAPVLLLDEPTSALDAESETTVVSSIFDLMRGRTTLIVAHRLSTVRRVDKVLVIERGAVTAFGSREELLAREGYFARMMTERTS